MHFFTAAIIAARLGSTIALPTRSVSDLSRLENNALSRENIDIANLLNNLAGGAAARQDRGGNVAQGASLEENEATLREAEAALKAKEEATAEGEAGVDEGKASVGEGEEGGGSKYSTS